MGKEKYALTLIFSLILNALPGISANTSLEQKQFPRHPGENRGPGLDSGFRRNDIQLLAANAEGFDFRDENNRPIDGNQEKIEALFLHSAYKLLVLGFTIPKEFTARLLDQNGWLDRLRLTGKRVVQKIIQLAAAFNNRFGKAQSPSQKNSSQPKISQPITRSGCLASPLLFRGALLPLRL